MMISRTTSALFILLAASRAVADTPTLWTFDDSLDPRRGPGVLSYYDPGNTNWGFSQTRFGAASRWGAPLVPDGQGGFTDDDVMCFPKTTPTQGYRITHNTPPNGVHAVNNWVSNYTLIWDIYWPAASDGKWRALYQTSTTNVNDADFYVRDVPSGGIGISGRYNGSLPPGEWHRVAVVIRAADGEGQLHKYIDGVFVGGQGTTGSAISSRWALDQSFLLFADESNDTQAGCVASFYYTDRNMDMEEVMALGGVNAAGANVPGLLPPPIGISTGRRVDIIGHRGKSCCAPENTLPALEQAFQTGATYTEIDIHRSSEGVAVLMHDPNVVRTTDGTGSVASMTVAQLKQLDAGSWFGPQYNGTRVPTLAEAMTLAKQYGRKLYLDLKLNGLGPAVAAAVAETGFAEEDLWLWHYGTDAETTNLLSHIPNGKIIYEPNTGQAGNPAYFQNLKNLGVWGFDGSAGTGNINAAFVQAAHNAGMYVSAYTILDPDAMRQAILNGVDGMETDFTHILDAMMPQHGDTNLDALVDRTDIATLAANLGRTTNATWAQGNFELPYANRAVNLTDLWLLQTNLSTVAPAGQVPEPATLALAAAALILVAWSKSRIKSKTARRS